MVFVAAFDATEFGLGLPVILRDMAATWARPAGVMRRYPYDIAALPLLLVGQLVTKKPPALAQYRLVESGFCRT